MCEKLRDLELVIWANGQILEPSIGQNIGDEFFRDFLALPSQSDLTLEIIRNT